MAGSNQTKKAKTESSCQRYWFRGEPYVWFCGASLTCIILIALLFLWIIVVNGAGMFWQSPLTLAHLKDGSSILGEIVDIEHDSNGIDRFQYKIGNRDLEGLDFRWISSTEIIQTSLPSEALALERTSYGNFYGFLANDSQDGHRSFAQGIANAEAHKAQLSVLRQKVSKTSLTMHIHKESLLKTAYQDGKDPASILEQDNTLRILQARFDKEVENFETKTADVQSHTVLLRDSKGTLKEVPFIDIVRHNFPNRMSTTDKLATYFERIGELLFDEPRESNTEGGLFPAIFGTIMMVILMSVLSFPLGVMAGIYLREYAKDGWFVRLIRIGVNNLAGIPSIVYGIFGLGFFVYGIGGSIDQLFFPERLPQPTYGTGGILWASLTLGLLTMPVVIVATEEALGMVPGELRQNSFALGATRLQTILKVLLPTASPGIMTGFILAMARAAGEVAPLMITGVVKLAPDLPLDGIFPYFHPERKFMHLGFHIFDISCQSPNVEAAKPMVYVTTLLLIAIVMTLASTAIIWRTKMKKKYAARTV